MQTNAHHVSDEALVLRKTIQKDSNQSITLLTKHHGKCIVTAFGTRRLLSKRLSHLETGNVIKCSWRENGEYKTLQETDLLYAHSAIKENSDKLNTLYLVFFVLFKLLPENEPEIDVYTETLQFLKLLTKKAMTMRDTEKYIQAVVVLLGFIDAEQAKAPGFDVLRFVEEIIGRKIVI